MREKNPNAVALGKMGGAKGGKSRAAKLTAEERIARLERDAESDEAQVSVLDDLDHIRRQMRLVAVERSEALRMRIFLDRTRTRLPRPLIAL